MACPQPVVVARKAILEAGVDCVRAVVDQGVSAENIQRMAHGQGWNVQVEQQGEEYQLTLTRGDGPAGPATEQPRPDPVDAKGKPQIVVFVTSDVFGQGDKKLGQILMKAFIKTLKELETPPQRIIFANSGVRLTTEGSDLVEELRLLQQQGVTILSCGTCLDYYGLLDSLQVGTATNMYEIATALVEADRIVQP
jgi:selenium metabolism protein YedF